MKLAEEIRARLGPVPELDEWPMVSIVVLNRDGTEHLRRLLAGLEERTDYPRFELILVDNASSDDSLEFVRRVEAGFPISIVANAHNESFADGCNQGAAIAVGELMLFLNNDAVPFEPGWLRELVAVLLHSGVGAVGPTLVEPASDAPRGFLVEQRGVWVREQAGALVPTPRHRHESPLGDCLGHDDEVMAVVGACLLISRETFDRVAGFSHGYWYGPEDLDLGLKLRQHGLTVRCSGRSLLVHRQNSTLSTVPAELRRQWAQGNRRLFIERWGPRARREYELDRLHGGGLWAEPCEPGASSWGSTEEEVEALGFCLKSAASDAAPGTDGTPSPEEVAAALRRRGRRAVVLRGRDVEGLGGYDYDVAVHVGGRHRYVPRPSQLNLLWLPPGTVAPPPGERARYDLVLDQDDPVCASADRCAERLLALSAELAERRRYRGRVAPSPAGTALVSP